jgi:hypothetical protein
MKYGLGNIRYMLLDESNFGSHLPNLTLRRTLHDVKIKLCNFS